MSPRGTYALLLRLDTPHTIEVGALGAFDFPAGWYLYCGSAHGPGGLTARLARHRRRTDKRFHWHIDYVRAATELVEAWISSSEARQECDWAAAATRLPGANIVADGLGSSDCGCSSHLIHYTQRPELKMFRVLIGTDVERKQIEDERR